MNHFNDEKEDETLPLEKILKQFTQQHFTNLKLQEHNNSFMFLEKSTLNLLLAYLLTNTKNETIIPSSKIVDEKSELKLIEQIDQLISDNEKEFSSIINLLKGVT